MATHKSQKKSASRSKAIGVRSRKKLKKVKAPPPAPVSPVSASDVIKRVESVSDKLNKALILVRAARVGILYDEDTDELESYADLLEMAFDDLRDVVRGLDPLVLEGSIK